MNCANCETLNCIKKGQNCSKYGFEVIENLSHEDKAFLTTAPTISGQKAVKDNRINELIDFAKAMDYKKLGIAFCVSTKKEASILSTILEKHFEVTSVCCKVGGIDKCELDIPKKNPDRNDPICNSVTQAKILNDDKTDLNILMGLCIGHDILIQKHTEAPCTTFMVRDFQTFHNPVGLLHSSQYFRKEKKKSK
ncbi:MAG: DUF1847 domain-containing protein [Firmicutes bacterium]|jgi:uncharacterized metal-binding protein|nr:DUF1847 domain-containing protein [Bacillota bacterium]